MIRRALYPVTDIELPIILLSNKYKSLENIRPMVCKGYCLEKKNLCLLDNREGSFQYTPIDFEELVATCDKVYISKWYIDSNPNNASQLHYKYGDKISLLNKERHFFENHYANMWKGNELVPEMIKNSNNVGMYSPKIPIIMVGSLVGECNKHEVAAMLSEEFKSLGYRSTAIISDVNYELINCVSYPNFFYEDKYNNNLKITLFNLYVKSIIEYNNLDILVIEVHGDVTRFSDRCFSGFGVDAFLISQAITPDKFILCTNCEKYKIEELNWLSLYVKSKFGFDTEYIHVSNKVVDYETLESTGVVTYHNSAFECVDTILTNINLEKIKNRSKIIVGNLLKEGEMERLVKHLISLF